MNTPDFLQKLPITAEVLRCIDVQHSASVSADGVFLAYVSTKADWDQNSNKDFITVLRVATGEPVAVLEGTAPQWSPVAAELAFIDSTGNEPGIAVYSLEDQLTKFIAPVYDSHYFMGHLSIKNFQWSPDGKMIAYTGTDRPESVSSVISSVSSVISSGSTNSSASSSSDSSASSSSDGVIVIDRLLYKTRGGGGRPAITDNMLTHIWIANPEKPGSKCITNGPYNEHSICWSPDSKQIAFASNRTQDPDNNQFHDLWSVEIASGKIIRFTEEFGTVFQPAWSPDGSAIAFLGTRNKIATNDSPAEDTQLYVIATADKNFHCLTHTFDRRIEQVSWHPDGDTIYFTAGDEGTISIYRIGADGDHDEHVLGEECQVFEYSIDKTGEQICFVKTDSTNPAEVFVYNLSSGETHQLSKTASAITETYALQAAESFWFTATDETDIQGWLIKPAGFDASKKYPLVLVIHGGPHNMFGYAFEDRMQLLSAKGYGVLYINPRGSSGYGQAFSYGCVLNWGGGDYKDLMAGVDAAIHQNTWIDAERLAVTGQSYGGYMTNWIVTQTNRFKAAVSDGGISNLVSFAGTSLYHSLIESEFNGSAYDNFPLLWQWSPISHVRNAKTPTLILHGELDNEVPLSQAEEMYIALKKLGVETRLVQYIGEGHGWRPDLKPRNRYDLLNRMISWFDQYLSVES